MKTIAFDSVLFDLDDKTFTVRNGSLGTYSYEDVMQCQIKYEDAKYKGKTKPFLHCVLSGPGQTYGFLEHSFYVGLKIVMKDRQEIAIYISKGKTMLNTSQYHKDMEEAKSIHAIFKKAIRKYGQAYH